MQKLIELLLLVTFTYQSEPLITRKFIEELRSQVTWEVEDYEKNIFSHWTVDEFKDSFCSDFELPNENSPIDETVDNFGDLPQAFDGRKKWPKCIHPIRRQAHCGSCWAFATAESISDRFCIAGKDVILSPQDLVSCDKSNKACGGGYGPYAMVYSEKHGLLSERCFPYVSGKDGRVPACPKSKCPGSGSFIKYHCKPGSTRIIKTRPEMKQEIMQYGPIATRFDHYGDFNAYKGGIYYHKSGKYLCGHYMKPVGWGVEKGINYWIIANTYGPQWGEKGYVRVKMGDSSVDKFMTCCRPAV